MSIKSHNNEKYEEVIKCLGETQSCPNVKMYREAEL